MHQNLENDSKIFLYAFAGITATILSLVIGLFATRYTTGDLIAPPLTGSISFDEKLMYFASSKQITELDISAVGSSMTLNNWASEPVTAAFDKNYLNYASWGQSFKQTDVLIRFIVSLHKPKVIIMVASPIDFYKNDKKTQFFDHNEVKEYLLNKDVLSAYFKHFDPIYFFNNSIDIKQNRQNNNWYESVMFDFNGGVLLDIEPQKIDKTRWSTTIDMDEVDPSYYTQLKELMTYLSSKNTTLIMIQPPIRCAAIKNQLTSLDMHWKKLSELTDNKNFYFINGHEAMHLDDHFFVDYTHLNKDGAMFFTQKMVDLIKPIVGRKLSKTEVN